MQLANDGHTGLSALAGVFYVQRETGVTDVTMKGRGNLIPFFLFALDDN